MFLTIYGATRQLIVCGKASRPLPGTALIGVRAIELAGKHRTVQGQSRALKVGWKYENTHGRLEVLTTW
jgi:hypothetical protein